MKINKDRILTATLVMCVLTGTSGRSLVVLSPEQESLRGVESMTAHASCSEDAKEIGINEEEIQKSIHRQLENAGIKVRPAQLWETLPGRYRLRVTVKVYKPALEEMFIYNLKVDFLQTVALERNPETKIDATTWERMWFAHGSKSRLVQTIPQNLKVLTASFIRDYRTANPRDKDTSSARNTNNAPPGTKVRIKPKPGSTSGKYGFIGSKSSDVFHKSDCRWASNISSENIVSYKTREEAVKAGKRPCKQCNP